MLPVVFTGTPTAYQTAETYFNGRIVEIIRNFFWTG